MIIGQDPPQQPPPAVRLAVDRVPVDVSVMGDDGRPVTGLAAADFTLDVDGRSRRIVSAAYVPSTRGAVPPRGISGDLQLQRFRRRTLSPQFRARVRRSRRQAAPDHGRGARPRRARHPGPQPVLDRGADEPDRRGDPEGNAAGAGARERDRPEARDLHAAGSRERQAAHPDGRRDRPVGQFRRPAGSRLQSGRREGTAHPQPGRPRRQDARLG